MNLLLKLIFFTSFFIKIYTNSKFTELLNSLISKNNNNNQINYLEKDYLHNQHLQNYNPFLNGVQIEKNSTIIVNEYFNSINNLYQKILEDAKNDISPKCHENLSMANLDEGLIYLLKFYSATSFFNNDINTFRYCNNKSDRIIDFLKSINYPDIEKKIDFNKTADLSYVLLYQEFLPEYEKIDIRSKTTTNIVGMCLHKDCSSIEYKHFLYQLNINTGSIFYNNKLDSDNPFETFDASTKLIEIKTEVLYFYEIIPIIIVLCFILLTFFPCTLRICFCCLIKSKRRNTSVIKSNLQTYSKINLNTLNYTSKEENKIENLNVGNSNNIINEQIEILTESKKIEFDFNDLDNSQNYYDENEEERCEYEQENIDNYYKNNIETENNFQNNRVKKSFSKDNLFAYGNVENLIKKISIKYHFYNFFETGNNNNNTESKNEIGLTAVKGMRGIVLILGFAGFVYSIILSNPFKVYNIQNHENMIKYFFISANAFGLRYSRKVLYTLSGYTLVYKFLYYLDNIIEKRKANENITAKNYYANNYNGNLKSSNNLKENFFNRNIQNQSSLDANKEKTLNISDKEPCKRSSYTSSVSDNSYSSSDEENTNNSSSNVSSDSSEEDETIYTSSISDDLRKYLFLKDYFRFILTQFHKYILLFISIFIFKYSYFDVKALFYNPKPLIYKLKILFEGIRIDQIFAMMSLIPIEDHYIFMHPLMEIRFFILYSFIIFIGYKYRLRIDLYCLFIFFTSFSYKIIFFYINKENMHPALFHYTDNKYTEKLNDDINMHHTFFIIGIFFGKVNYIIQKGIKTREKLIKKGKNFLCWAFQLATFFNRLKNRKFICTKIFWITTTFILIFFFTNSYSIFYNILGYDMKKDNLVDLNKNLGLKIFYLIDAEIFIWFLMINFMLVTNPGKNILNSFLGDENWKFFSKPYFSIICLLPLILLDFIHHANYRIRIDIFNITFYSIIAWSIILFFSICNYIHVESPLRNFVRFFIPKID